jgi:hypothetical protein
VNASTRRPASRAAALLVLSLLVLLPGAGQDPAPGLDRAAAMRRFDAWVGDWSGSGWSLDAAGHRTDFTLVEHVQPRAGGTVLLLEGRGTARAEDGTDTVTHDGLVLVYYDEHALSYRWNGHEVRSGTMDTEVRVFDGGLEWSLAMAGAATVRFTIHFGDGRWHETGEAGADGSGWHRFMEMNLQRGG